MRLQRELAAKQFHAGFENRHMQSLSPGYDNKEIRDKAGLTGCTTTMARDQPGGARAIQLP